MSDNTIKGNYNLKSVLEKIDLLKADVDRSNINDENRREMLAKYIQKLLLFVPTEIVLEHHLHDKLWNICFYEFRIQRMRPMVANRTISEDFFSEFLGKSIDFYKKTISDYKSSGQYIRQGTKSTTEEDPNFNPSDILLNSLSTRIGDLYRYKKNFKDAEAAYRKAIEYHPYMDSPYNTLGVIEVEKEHYFNALYYFIQGYTGANRNITSVFLKNSKFLSTIIPSEEFDKLKAGGGPMSQKSKGKITKVLLSEFVEIHRMLYEFSTPSNRKNTISIASKIDQLQQQEDEFLKHLGFLLNEEELSKSFVLNMIVINIFFVDHLEKCILSKSAEEMNIFYELDEQQRMRFKSIPSMALNFAYRFATILIEHFKKAFSNNEEGGGESRFDLGNRSFRYMAALQLFCDWLATSDTPRRLSNHDEHFVSEQAAAAAYAEQQNFFASIASAWNQFSDLHEYTSSLARGVVQINPEAKKMIFKEYYELRGFTLFSSFIPQSMKKSSASLDNKQELEGRICRLFQFLCSYQDLIILDKNGHFQLQSEDDECPVESFADDTIRSIENDFCSPDAHAALGTDVEALLNYAVDSTHVHLSSPNISVNFDETDHLDDLGESVAYAGGVEARKHVIGNIVNTPSLEALTSQKVTDGQERQQDIMKPISRADTSSLEASKSQIVTDGRERQQDLMKPISQEGMLASTQGETNDIQGIVQKKSKPSTYHISNDRLNRFLEAVLANPFEKNRLSLRPCHDTKGQTHIQNRSSHVDMLPPATHLSSERYAKFLRAVSSNPFEANRLSSEKIFQKKVSSRSPLLDNSSSVELHQNRVTARYVKNHYKHSFSKNSSTYLPYPPLPSFAKHGDPQSLLFDSHPGLSIEERAARNALILYGIHETPNCVDHKRYFGSRKRSCPS
jgi:tetratricopeptide (TPR) repeat protein